VRRLLAALSLGCLLAAVAATASSAAGQPRLRLTELGGTQFPERAYILSLPSARTVTAGDIRILENGERVTDVSAVAATALGSEEFALALLIDASKSMKGEPIENAMAAARAFAAKRKPTQQLAVVVFNADTEVVLPFTTDGAAIDAALAQTPPVVYYTRTYDALNETIDLLQREKIGSASIVLLSDGQEVDSRLSLDAAIGSALKADVRIFTVGLQSRFFDPSTLKDLSYRTGGFYTEARTPKELAGIFEHLGTQLGNEYVVRYRSLAPPRARIRVEATVAGVHGVADSGYVTPALSVGPTKQAKPHHRSLGTALWQSRPVMFVFALFAAGLVGFAATAVVYTRQNSLRHRVSQFVSLTTGEAEAAPRSLSTRVFETAERSLSGTKWWSRFKEELEIGEVTIPAVHLVLGTLVATVLVFWLGSVIGGMLLAAPALLVPLVVRGVINRKLRRKRALFLEQLPDNLGVLASALRAGHSLVGALAVVVNDAPEPSKSEFRRAVADEQLGVSLEQALTTVAHRMSCRDLEQVAMVAALGRDTGGNTAEVLDRLTETIRDRFELRRLVSSLTAQGRMSRWVVSALPVGLLAIISLINPEYIKPLYTKPAGQVLLVLSGIMVVSGSLIIKRIVNIRV
jgi:tight adherence protein B